MSASIPEKGGKSAAINPDQLLPLGITPSDSISSICFQPAGLTSTLASNYSSTNQPIYSSDFLLCASWDRTLTLYRIGIAAKDSIRVMKTQGTDPYLAACFHSLLPMAFAAGLSQEIDITDLSRGDSIPTRKFSSGHTNAIRNLIFDSESQLLFSGSWDGTVGVWDIRSSTPLVARLPTIASERVYAMSQSGSRLIVGTSNRSILIYDIRALNYAIATNATGMSLTNFEPENRRLSPLLHQTRCISGLHDGTGFTIGSTDGRVGVEYFDNSEGSNSQRYAFRCHNVPDGQFVKTMPVNTIANHPTCSNISVTGGGDSAALAWDIKKRKNLHQFDLHFDTSVSSLCFNSSGDRIAMAVSYAYEQGELNYSPPIQIYVRGFPKKL